jgi:hypothetical protein
MTDPMQFHVFAPVFPTPASTADGMSKTTQCDSIFWVQVTFALFSLIGTWLLFVVPNNNPAMSGTLKTCKPSQ